LVTVTYSAAAIIGQYESDTSEPLTIEKATMDADKSLIIQFSDELDPDSIKLSNIKKNGKALSDEKDAFTLSNDGKTLIITLNPVRPDDGFQLTIGGLKSNDEILLSTADDGISATSRTSCQHRYRVHRSRHRRYPMQPLQQPIPPLVKLCPARR